MSAIKSKQAETSNAPICYTVCLIQTAFLMEVEVHGACAIYSASLTLFIFEQTEKTRKTRLCWHPGNLIFYGIIRHDSLGFINFCQISFLSFFFFFFSFFLTFFFPFFYYFLLYFRFLKRFFLCHYLIFFPSFIWCNYFVFHVSFFRFVPLFSFLALILDFLSFVFRSLFLSSW